MGSEKEQIAKKRGEKVGEVLFFFEVNNQSSVTWRGQISSYHIIEPTIERRNLNEIKASFQQCQPFGLGRICWYWFRGAGDVAH